MLHNPLIDLFAKDMATRTGELHQRTLGRTRRNLVVRLIPIVHGGCMSIDILKSTNTVIHCKKAWLT